MIRAAEMKSLRYLSCFLLLSWLLAPTALACDAPARICYQPTANGIALVENRKPLTVITDAHADPAVQRAAAGFAEDLKRVSGRSSKHINQLGKLKGPAVVIGVVGNSPLIDGLIADGKLAVEVIHNKWEGFQITVVDNPWPKVPNALVIIGSDRRGAVFGAYDVSEAMGVSPWYW